MSKSNNQLHHRRGNGRDRALLGLLAVIALLAGMTFARGDDRVRADLLYQVSPPTETPDPNSPIPTPTFTPTPFPTDTPTEPSPTDMPVQALTDTPLPALTDTPLPALTDTPLPVLTDTPLPTSTAADLQPIQPIATPETPTPTVTATETASPTPWPTSTLRAVVVLPAKPAEPATGPRIDPALFIDNLVIAFGYVWICLGGLLLVIVALGAYLLQRRPRNLQATPVTPPPAQPAGQTPVQPPPPPPPQRVAARHRRRSQDDID